MRYVTLNNGVKMPMQGFGVYQIPDHDECVKAVSQAIACGYRLLDTAQAYFNEEAVGEAVAKSGIPREEFFIVTKVWITNSGEDQAYASILRSLERLQTGYCDLILIHQPFGDYYGTYRALERAYREGKTRAIGVSNFYPDRFIDLCEHVEVKPAVNQVETHVFCQQRKAREFYKNYGTRIMSWGPFAEGRNDFFKNETLKKVGAAHGKSLAQAALRFLIDDDVVIIPKSVKPERMKENLDIWDFSLTEAEMQEIRAMDLGHSVFFSHYDPEFVNMLMNYKLIKER